MGAERWEEATFVWQGCFQLTHALPLERTRIPAQVHRFCVVSFQNFPLEHSAAQGYRSKERKGEGPIPASS